MKLWLSISVLCIMISGFASGQTPKSLSLRDFNEEATTYLIDQISAAKSKQPKDVTWASKLYASALRTKIVRREFLAAVSNYRDVLLNRGSFLEREEAYYAVGLTADNLLGQIERLKQVVSEIAVDLDLQHPEIEDELGLYSGQRGIVLHSVIDKPKLLGLNTSELTQLLNRLSETGKHLDTAIDGLRTLLLQRFPEQDFAGTLGSQSK